MTLSLELQQIGLPRAIGSAAEDVAGARGDPARMVQILYSTAVPMVVVDGERRYIHANASALLAFRTHLAELREHRIENLTPPHRLPMLEALWRRLVATGRVAGRYDVHNRDGTTLRIVFYARSGGLPGHHVIAFAPVGWSDRELAGGASCPLDRPAALTRRELELLQLAAEGRSGPRIAEELTVSPATVKTHFEHIYTKLGVRDRAAAVAKGIRLGLIQ